MKDRFEIFIKDAVTNTSVYSPQKQNIWTAIDHKLHKRIINKRVLSLKIAASILLLIGVSMYFVHHKQKAALNYYNETVLEISETTNYYANLIDVEYKKITETKNLNKAYYKLFFDEIELLDKEYNDYIKDAKQFGFQEDIVRALLNNQQQKLIIINRLLIEIKKVKDYENRKINI